jgi:fucose permease
MVLAVIGVAALYFLFGWLASAIAAAYLSNRKGYGERPGLALGLLIPVVSVIVWVLWPAKPDSDWKVIGPFGRQSAVD